MCAITVLAIIVFFDCNFDEWIFSCDFSRLFLVYCAIVYLEIQPLTVASILNKKLCYRRRTARRAMSLKILSTVETSCTTNPQQIAGEGYTVDRLVINSHDSSTRLSYRCRQQIQPSTTTRFVDNAMDLSWRNFLSPEFGTKSQREVP